MRTSIAKSPVDAAPEKANELFLPADLDRRV